MKKIIKYMDMNKNNTTLNKIPENLLEILACPDCRSDLDYDSSLKLVCSECSLEYKVIDGIPILLPSIIGNDQVLANRSFSPEYRAILKEETQLKMDKYGQADMDLIDGPSEKKEKFLEIGCGRGRVCNNYSALKRFKIVVGLDLSIDALVLAKKISDENNLNSYFVCGDIENPPFKSNSFDLVFGGGSFEHFKNTKKGITSLRYIVEEKGEVVLTVPCISLTTLLQGIITGNTPDIFILRGLYNFLHTTILKDKYRMFGFEYSFLPKRFSQDFNENGFKTYAYGNYNVEYDLKFIPFGKKYINRILKKKIFWPMLYLKCKRLK